MEAKIFSFLTDLFFQYFEIENKQCCKEDYRGKKQSKIKVKDIKTKKYLRHA
jgi:hypothetical protein